jgi:hypothetical protein
MPGNLIELFDSQAEWQSGTLENLDATTTPGVIIPTGDYTKTYDSKAEWDQGSMSSVQSAAGGTIALTPVPQNWKAATVTASSYQDSSRAPAMAFDGDTDTYWLATSSSNEWLKFDYGSTKRTVTKLRIYIDSTDDLQVKNFQLQGSDDGSQWTTLATGRTTLGANGWQEWDVPSPRQYRYYRLMCLDNHAPASQMIAVREMEFILQTQYPGSGTWTSPWLAHSISNPQSGLVSLRADIPAGTSVIPRVRYSPNGGSTYTQWYDLDDRRMTDVQGTHVQLRLTLTTDDTKQTPTVDRAILLVGKLHRWTSPAIDLAGVDADATLMLSTSQTELDVVREVREPFNLHFTRSSTAYHPETGAEVAVNEPRYVEGPFEGSQAVLVEEGTTPVLQNSLFTLDSNSDGLCDNWTKYSDHAAAAWTQVNITGWGGKAQRCEITGTAYPYVQLGVYQLCTMTPGSPISLRVVGVTSKPEIALILRDDTHGINFAQTMIPVTPGTPFDVSFSSTVPDGCVSGRAYAYTRQGTAWTVGDYVEFYAVCVENKAYSTTPTDVARSPELPTIPITGVLSPTEGTWEQWVYIGEHQRRLEENYVFYIPRSGAAAPGIALYHNKYLQQWQLHIENDAGASDLNTIPDTYTPDGWHLFRVTWSAAKVELRIDGVSRINRYFPKLPSSFAATAFIGHKEGGAGYLNTAHADIRLSSIARTDNSDLVSYQNKTPLPKDEHTTYKMAGGLWTRVGAVFPRPAWRSLQTRLTLTKTDSVAQSLDKCGVWDAIVLKMLDRPQLTLSPPQVTHVTAYVENSEPLIEYTASLPGVPEAKKVHIRRAVPEGSTLAYCQEVAEKVLAIKSKERLSVSCRLPLLTRMRFIESVAVALPYMGYTKEKPYIGAVQRMVHKPLADPPYTQVDVGDFSPGDVEALIRLLTREGKK